MSRTMLSLSEDDPFERAVLQVYQLHLSKGDDYALDADPWSNFRTTAELTGLTLQEVTDVFVLTKFARLTALKANGREPNHESVLDTRRDIAVYALIALAMTLDERDPVECTPPTQDERKQDQ
jgi:hypothetical protein